MARKLAIMCGLPASGKSTYCRELQKQGWLVVSPDIIRTMLYDAPYLKEFEVEVWNVTKLSARVLLRSNYDVVIDATNTTKWERKGWREMANGYNAEFSIYYVDTPFEECVRRDMQRLNPVGYNVLERMHKKFTEPSEDEGNIIAV